jgi:hypothetical protein
VDIVAAAEGETGRGRLEENGVVPFLEVSATVTRTKWKVTPRHLPS